MERSFLLHLAALNLFYNLLFYLFKRNKIYRTALNIIKYKKYHTTAFFLQINTIALNITNFSREKLRKALEPSYKKADAVTESTISLCMIVQTAKNQRLL